MKTIITSAQAPAALGPYSQAVRCGNLIFLSGQLGIVPESGELAQPDAAAQAKQALANLGAVLEAAGSSYARVIKTTVFLANMSDFAAVNEVYGSVFNSNPPARSCFAVAALPKNGLVEIEAIAETE